MAGVSRPAKTFTPKQGQYLAFIHLYTRLHRRPPAETDMQEYFRVSPPSVHQMVLTLEQAGFIRRQPRTARSIELLVEADTAARVTLTPDSTGQDHCAEVLGVPRQLGVPLDRLEGVQDARAGVAVDPELGGREKRALAPIVDEIGSLGHGLVVQPLDEGALVVVARLPHEIGRGAAEILLPVVGGAAFVGLRRTS